MGGGGPGRGAGLGDTGRGEASSPTAAHSLGLGRPQAPAGFSWAPPPASCRTSVQMGRGPERPGTCPGSHSRRPGLAPLPPRAPSPAAWGETPLWRGAQSREVSDPGAHMSPNLPAIGDPGPEPVGGGPRAPAPGRVVGEGSPMQREASPGLPEAPGHAGGKGGPRGRGRTLQPSPAPLWASGTGWGPGAPTPRSLVAGRRPRSPGPLPGQAVSS